MLYRPEYQLDLLRRLQYCSCSDSVQQQQHLQLALPWLRTVVVDLSRLSRSSELAAVLEQPSISAAAQSAERFVLRGELPQCDVERRLASSLIACRVGGLFPHLVSLDLRCFSLSSSSSSLITDLVSEAARSFSLRSLHLPYCCEGVTHAMLEPFTKLEVLGVEGSPYLTSVAFCSANLRVLCANDCFALTNEGLRNATRIEVLLVRSCRQVSDLSPFAHCLLELDASVKKDVCGVSSDSLVNCHRLQVLNAYDNLSITTLAPFAHRLREVNVSTSLFSSLSDDSLAAATSLVKLDASYNDGVTTVAPFGATLRELCINDTDIHDEGLQTATNIVVLSASGSPGVADLAPFASQLLELTAGRRCGVCDEALEAARPKLVLLNTSENMAVTTVEPFASSLRHVEAGTRHSGLTDEGLAFATKLVELSTRDNLALTTSIRACQSTLQVWTTTETALLLLQQQGPSPSVDVPLPLDAEPTTTTTTTATHSVNENNRSLSPRPVVDLDQLSTTVCPQLHWVHVSHPRALKSFPSVDMRGPLLWKQIHAEATFAVWAKVSDTCLSVTDA